MSKRFIFLASYMQRHKIRKSSKQKVNFTIGFFSYYKKADFPEMRKIQSVLNSSCKELSPELYCCAIQNVRQQNKNLPQNNCIGRETV